MSRYEEDRARGVAPEEALRLAMGGTWRGTLVASMAASAAYASLTVTSFRGFSQFGVMGAAGALACWIATYTVLPALLVLLDRREAKDRPKQRAPIELAPLAGLLRRHAAVVSVSVIVAAVVAAVGLRHFLRDPFEYDFRKLNAKLNTTDEAKQFGRSLDDLFGRLPSPTVILADDVSEVELIKAGIRRNDEKTPGGKVIGQITTIYDVLPGDPASQRRKLALLESIRKLTHDPALEVLNDKERADLAKIDPPADLHELGPMDLPAIARRPFTEVDGTVGKPVLVYPVEKGISVWYGRDLLRISGALQRILLSNGKEIESSGFAVVFGAMIRSILHDGPIATLASLIAVLVIIAFTIRPSRAALMAARNADPRRALDGGGRRLGRRARHLPQFHRPSHHLRNRRGICPQRGDPLPRKRGHRAHRDLHRRSGGRLFLDHDRRLRLVAGGA